MTLTAMNSDHPLVACWKWALRKSIKQLLVIIIINDTLVIGHLSDLHIRWSGLLASPSHIYKQPLNSPLSNFKTNFSDSSIVF